MDRTQRFSDADLTQIIEEAAIYMCACPAQLADAMRKLRELHRYQMRCINQTTNDAMVHGDIAASTVQAHALLQDCLDRVLELEQWDRSSLRMPPHLRQRQLREMLSED